MNLRTRFALTSGAIVFVLATAMSIGAYRIATQQLDNQVTDSLNQRVGRITQQLENQRSFLDDAFGRGFNARAIFEPDIDSFTQIITTDGIVHHAPGYPDLPVTEAESKLEPGVRVALYRDVTIDGRVFRMMTVRSATGELIQVAKDTQIIERARNGMQTWLPILAAIAVIISGAISWLFASRVSKPISQLAETAEDIAATQNLDRRIIGGGMDEVGKLSTSFNTMLDALRNSSERQRRLVQDASHELRTPLTSLRANAELLERANLSAEDRASILSDMRAEVDELVELSAELNALATDQRAAESPESVDLDELAHEIATRAQRRTSAPITVHVTPDTIVRARPQQLERAISNLVDNAIKFSEGTSPVEIHVGSHRVEVRDHGPGISDADKAMVFDRFYRSTSTRSMPGSGLGLAIVAQFAEDNDAHTYVLDNAGGGAIVGIQFTE